MWKDLKIPTSRPYPRPFNENLCRWDPGLRVLVLACMFWKSLVCVSFLLLLFLLFLLLLLPLLPPLLLLLISFLATQRAVEFLGQGSEPSRSCDLSQSNAGSLTNCAGPGIEPATQHSQDATSPVAPQQKLLFFFFFLSVSFFGAVGVPEKMLPEDSLGSAKSAATSLAAYQLPPFSCCLPISLSL